MLKTYNEDKKNEIHKKIYHFKYKGTVNGSLTFENSLLSEKNTENELFVLQLPLP